MYERNNRVRREGIRNLLQAAQRVEREGARTAAFEAVLSELAHRVSTVEK